MAATQLGQLAGGQVTDEPARGAGSGQPALDLVDVAAAERQVEGETLDADAARALRAAAQVVGREAVPVHRGQRLEHDPRRAVAGSESRQVLEPADRVHQPRGSSTAVSRKGRHGSSTRTSPAKRCATSGTSAYVPTAIVSAPSQLGSARKPADGEAVAVALGDRDEARVGSATWRADVRASAGRRRTGSDGIAQRLSSTHVEVERLVEQGG